MMRDAAHFALDLAGFIPLAGPFADGLNALWYAREGRLALAALSLISAVPIAGDAVAATKIAVKGGKLMKKVPLATKLVKTGQTAEKGAKAATFVHKLVYQLQHLMGVKRFFGRVMWKQMAKAIDNSATDLDRNKDEIMDIIGKVGGDPGDPETQELVLQLANQAAGGGEQGPFNSYNVDTASQQAIHHHHRNHPEYDGEYLLWLRRTYGEDYDPLQAGTQVPTGGWLADREEEESGEGLGGRVKKALAPQTPVDATALAGQKKRVPLPPTESAGSYGMMSDLLSGAEPQMRKELGDSLTNVLLRLVK